MLITGLRENRGHARQRGPQMLRPGSERELGSLRELKVAHKEGSMKLGGVSRERKEVGTINRHQPHDMRSLVSLTEGLH